MKRIFSWMIVAAIGWPCTVAGAEQLAASKTSIEPIAERFADNSAIEIPDFQRHVVPLLGRLGCNGRACHGSFQGAGGFQLSLFGYDFQADHEQLMDPDAGRVDVDDVVESLMLAKPSDADMHEGGKRFDLGSWQHHVLRNWVTGGAKFDADDVLPLINLEIQPAEIRFDDQGQSVPLTAIAHWPGGITEDVTALCRFTSNDDSIARIDEHGVVSSGDQGDTHVVVYYDSAVVPVEIVRPIGSPTDRAPSVSNRIDRLVQQKLDKLGVTPSSVCSDSEFIRRASLDVIGVLPSAERVREFLANTNANKRNALVEELLQSPGYAAWWATRLSDWTGNSEEQLNNVLPVRNVGTKLWYEWLRARLATNMPYDEIIEGIVTANTRQEGETYLEYCETMTKACSGEEELFAQREGMPLFWGRRNFQKPEERAIGFAYTFLGVRIECAQCHKHPFDEWSKQDFEDFSSLFSPIKAGNLKLVSKESREVQKQLTDDIVGDRQLDNGELRRAIYDAAKDGKVVPFGELLVNVSALSDRAKQNRKRANAKGQKVPAMRVPTGRILGEDGSMTLDADPRPALMQWLRDAENPYFAKAIVNRVWANYFGIGIVNPTDDMNLANPPSNAALMNDLASRFIENNFDLLWLHREILASDTYQRSSATNETNRHDRLNFARHVPRRMPAEVVYDMVALATGSNTKADLMRSKVDEMAIAESKPRGKNRGDFALEVFGQSIRESNCDCDRSDSPSLLQSIYLRNDVEMYQRIADRDGWVAEACKSLGVPGPANTVGKNGDRADSNADSFRKRAIAAVERYQQVPEKRQKQMLPRLERNYATLRGKLVGYEVPTLATLLQHPDSWTKLVRSNFDGSTSGDEAPRSNPTSRAAVRPTSIRPISIRPAAMKTLPGVVEEAYLRTLSRIPEQEETEIAVQYIEQSKSVSNGIEGLLWALVNTKEFIISH